MADPRDACVMQPSPTGTLDAKATYAVMAHVA
jgi:hypothetical protein